MRWGLNFKFICFTVFIIAFISITFSVVFVYQSRKALLNEFTRRGQSLVKNLALNAELPILLEDKATLVSLAQNLLKENDVERIKILNHMQEVLVDRSKGRNLWWWQKEEIAYPVFFKEETGENITEDMSFFFSENKGKEKVIKPGQVIGMIEVVFSRESIIKTLNRIRWWIFLAAAFATIIGAVVGLYFSYHLIRPIQRLANATSSIASGNWDERLEVARKDELGQLTVSFNTMAASLVKKRNELEKTYRELAQKDRMAEIGKFSMMIAHELKNPIGIIKGAVDILSKDDTKPQVSETMFRYIRDEVKRLNKLIDDFLNFAKPVPPQKAPVDINKIIQKITGHFMIPEESKKNISLNMALSDLPPVEVDEHQIYQALLNIVNNAAQSIDKQGAIYFKTTRKEDSVCIEIADTGTGIADDDKVKVFMPFFTTKAQGTGLGLSIVKKIIDNHGGHIQIFDRPGGGTVFAIFIPV